MKENKMNQLKDFHGLEKEEVEVFLNNKNMLKKIQELECGKLICTQKTIDDICDYLDYYFEEWPTISGQLESGSWGQFGQAAIDTGFIDFKNRDEIVFKNEEAGNNEEK